MTDRKTERAGRAAKRPRRQEPPRGVSGERLDDEGRSEEAPPASAVTSERLAALLPDLPPFDAHEFVGKVVIFGAGIAGLTAAHELGERRFQVWVVEPSEDMNRHGDYDQAIGGMARTQYVAAEKKFGPPHGDMNGSRSYLPKATLHAEGDGQRLTGVSEDRLRRILKYVKKNDRVLVNASPSVGLAEQQVRALLREAGADPGGPPPGSTPPEGLAIALSPTKEFTDRHHLLPGEHGFRFFPSYYRHLFSTIDRIPVYEREEKKKEKNENDDKGGRLTDRPTGRHVYDNLVSTPVQALVSSTINPLRYPRTPARSLISVFRQLQEVLLCLGYDLRDVGQFAFRVARYMFMGKLRRAKETEDISWWDYLCGHDPATGMHRYRYSEAFTNDVLFAPRVLLAADPQWGDARSIGSTFAQLLLDQLDETDYVDGILNAPTTEAWFEHWQMYLCEELGATFVKARLDRMVWNGHRVVPELMSVDDDPSHKDKVEQLQALIDDDGEIKYYVLATDAVNAERLTRNLGQRQVGVARDLQGFESMVAASPRGGTPARPRAHKRYGEADWDRFQTLSGVQFFFRSVFRIFEGHVYYLDAPWALSSINQQQFWRRRPTVRRSPYRGMVSVDIGAFDAPAKRPNGPTAWDCPDPDHLATEVWDQVCDALAGYWSLHGGGPEPQRAVGPAWFHLDSNIDLREKENKTPYLIPIVGDWKNRPGADPWDPGHPTRSAPVRRPSPYLWQAPHGGYEVHWDQWVFAGTYLRHFTRLTSMEAANETGRHAVNAILDHVTSEDPEAHIGSTAPVHGFPAFRVATYRPDPSRDPYSVYVPTPYGEYCHIWDIERYEHDDIEPWREIDDWLCERGCPHPWDMLGCEHIPMAVSHLPGPSDFGLPTVVDLLRAWRRVLRRSRRPSGESYGRPGYRPPPRRPPWPWPGGPPAPSVWTYHYWPLVWPLSLFSEICREGRRAWGWDRWGPEGWPRNLEDGIEEILRRRGGGA